MRRFRAIAAFTIFMLFIASCKKTVSVKEEDYNTLVQSVSQQNSQRFQLQQENAALTAKIKQLQTDEKMQVEEDRKVIAAKDQTISELSKNIDSLQKVIKDTSDTIKSKDVELAVNAEQLSIHKQVIDRTRDDLSNSVKASADAVASQRQSTEEIKFRDEEITSLRVRLTDLEEGGIPIIILGKQLPQVVANYSLMAAAAACSIAGLCLFVMFLLYLFSKPFLKHYDQQIFLGIEHKGALTAAFGEFMERVKIPVFIAGTCEAVLFLVLMLKQFSGGH